LREAVILTDGHGGNKRGKSVYTDGFDGGRAAGMDREEIEKALLGLPRAKVVAFAVRAALRALPMLASVGQDGVAELACWKPEDRARHLLAVFGAVNIGMLWILASEDAAGRVTDSADPASAFHAAASAAYYATAVAAATAVHDASASATAVTHEGSATAAAAAAAHAILANPAINGEIECDLKVITLLRTRSFFQSSLWADPKGSQTNQRFQTLKTAALALDAGFEYWLDWLEDRYAGRDLDADLQLQSTQIPAIVREQGVAAINAYLQQLKQRTITAPLNRVRAIFIGYGDAGKTSLVNVLHNEPVAVQEPMTPGIDIREWPVPGTDIKAHFWDFGGQVMAHATHQLFLRDSCLYVLVLCARSEINATEQAEYWLEHVKSFGKGAPVLIVGNKSDQTSLNLNMDGLCKKYPTIVGFYPLSCTQATTAYAPQFACFKQAFEQQLLKVGTHQMLFSDAQFCVLQRLRELTAQSSFLKHDEFDAICTEYAVPTTGVQNRAWLLDILDKLGVIVHFPKLTFLDEYVLNPRWLTYGVYTLMYSHQARLCEADVIAILGREQVKDEIGQALSYPKNRCRLIMDAMREFKLCYTLPGSSDTLIIPALLPPSPPAKPLPPAFAQAQALAFAFEFASFLPRHVLPELIVNRHLEIIDQTVWQHGVLLAHARLQAQALIEVDYHLRTLTIAVNGVDARDYLLLLREDIHQILARLDIDFEESLALPDAARIGPRRTSSAERAPYLQILAYDQQKTAEYISKSGTRYDVNKVLLGYVSEKNLERERKQFVVNIHNSRLGDLTVADMIDGSFNQTQQAAPSPASPSLPPTSGFWAELARLFQRHGPFGAKK
jgi:hypothetical protein